MSLQLALSTPPPTAGRSLCHLGIVRTAPGRSKTMNSTLYEAQHGFGLLNCQAHGAQDIAVVEHVVDFCQVD